MPASSTHPAPRRGDHLRDALDRLLAAARRQPVRRVRETRWVGGVAAGVARRLRVDPILVRIAFVCLTFTMGAGVSLYLLAWVLLPELDDDRIVLQDAAHDHAPGAIALVAGAALTFLAVAPPNGSSPGALVPMLAVGALAWFLLWRDGGWHAPADRVRPTAGPDRVGGSTFGGIGAGRPEPGAGHDPAGNAGRTTSEIDRPGTGAVGGVAAAAAPSPPDADHGPPRTDSPTTRPRSGAPERAAGRSLRRALASETRLALLTVGLGGATSGLAHVAQAAAGVTAPRTDTVAVDLAAALIVVATIAAVRAVRGQRAIVPLVVTALLSAVLLVQAVGPVHAMPGGGPTLGHVEGAGSSARPTPVQAPGTVGAVHPAAPAGAPR